MNRLSPEIANLARSRVAVFAYLEYREYLDAVYSALKDLIPHYSYVLFSEDLGFSKSNVLHLIIRGKRPLTSKAAERIVKSLHLVGHERQYFQTLVEYQNGRDNRKREDSFQRLLELKNSKIEDLGQRAVLEFFSEWYHPTIYEMMSLDEFQSDPKWIAARLQMRIRPEQARKSLQLLETLGLVKFDKEKKRHVSLKTRLSTGDEIASVAVIRYHQRLIDMAKESVTMVKEAERDISAISVSVSRATAERMKAEIQSFRKRMLALAEEAKGSKDAVYQMNIQLFPLTRDFA